MVWNLTSSAFLANPQPQLERMRAAGPLVETRVPLIGRTWVTTTAAAARALLKDPRFVRDPRTPTGRTMRQTLWFLPRFLSPMLDSLILRDGEEHKRLRRLKRRTFKWTHPWPFQRWIHHRWGAELAEFDFSSYACLMVFTS